MLKTPSWFKNKFIIGAVIALVAFISFKFLRTSSGVPQTLVVEPVTLTSGVSVTGKVVPLQEVKLAFETSGRISEVVAKVGDKVGSGQILARIDTADVYAKLLQAQAERDTAQSKLDALLKGARPEELAVSEVKVLNAEVSQDDAKRGVVNAIIDAYTKSDDAIRNKVDQFMTNPRSQYPKLSFSADFQLTTNIEAGRQTVESTLISWHTGVSETTPVGDLGKVIVQSEMNLLEVRNFLDIVSLAVNALTPSSSLSQTTISGYKTDIVTARTNVNTALSALATAKEKFRLAQSTLTLAQKQLVLDKAPATTEDALAETARVKSAEANVANYQNQLAKTSIRAPFAGVISLQNSKVGQIASPGTPVISMGSELLIVEAFVPEIDIAQIALGNTADLTLDAYGDESRFKATITAIDPGETVVDGVSTYKVQLRFTTQDVRMRSGMTANVSVVTNKKEQVLALPNKAISTRDGEHFVKVVSGDGALEIKVTTGVRGSNGLVEIISGLQAGDTVLISPN